MKIKVLVNGAFGRMGQLSAKAISEHPQLELVGQTGREYDLAKSIIDSGAEVVVDFTHPSSVFDNTCTIIAAGARPVVGTSGLTKQQIKILRQKCLEAQLGGMIVPNFSLGAVLMMKYAKEIVKYIPQVEIIEMHHEGKADSPSGTSLRTAEMLSEANPHLNQPSKPSHETVAGARGAQYYQVPIHAIRLPGIVAQQQIIFGAHGETLSLHHQTTDRSCFMPGVCLACEKVMQLKELMYGLEDIL